MVRTRIVSSAEIAASPGCRLDAAYYIEKGQKMDTQTVTQLPASGQHDVEVKLLRESGLNQRREFNKQKMEDLVASVRAHGILENLVLRPIFEGPDESHVREVLGYQVIAGNRRWKAAVIAGLEKIPASIRDLSDDDAREIILIENIQREDVHPLEEAEGYLALSKTYQDMEVLAGKVGKKPTYVKLRLQLNQLIEPAKKAFWKGQLHLEHALEIARLTEDEQKQTMKECAGGWDGLIPIRRLKEFIQRNFHLQLTKAPFSLEDAELIPAAGPCTTCPKRTGANTLLFPDVKEQDTCTDPKCFDAKVGTQIANTKQLWLNSHHGEALVPVSTVRYRNPVKGVLSCDEYEIVKGKDAKAPGVKSGIVVAGDDIGKIVSFREPQKGTSAAASQPLTTRKSNLEQKNRELETKQHNEEDMLAVPFLVQAIKEGTGRLALDELVLVAHECIARTYHDMLKRYCDAIFGAGTIGSAKEGRDYAGAVEKRAVEVVKDPVSLSLFLLEVQLFNHIGRSREIKEAKDRYSKPNPIYLIAKNRGVEFKELWVPLAEKYGVRKQRAASRLGLGESPSKSGKKQEAPGSKAKKTKAEAVKKPSKTKKARPAK